MDGSYKTIDETVERISKELAKRLADSLVELLKKFEGHNPPMSGHWE